MESGGFSRSLKDLAVQLQFFTLDNALQGRLLAICFLVIMTCFFYVITVICFDYYIVVTGSSSSLSGFTFEEDRKSKSDCNLDGIQISDIQSGYLQHGAHISRDNSFYRITKNKHRHTQQQQWFHAWTAGQALLSVFQSWSSRHLILQSIKPI